MLPFPATAGVARAPDTLTAWGMFVHADIIVQAVMVGLALASLVTWTVLLAKSWEFSRLRRRLGEARDQVLAAVRLRDIEGADALQHDIPRSLLDATVLELRLSHDVENKAGVSERVASRLDRMEARHLRELRKGASVLATIGATAPFVGLFGTVWGIMNSFVGIAESNTTNLAVVAPGIAEALLATALGLVAAIPAVVIYNHFARSLAGLRGVLGDISAGIQQVVSRDLDRRTQRQAP
jgi:biopolymer transport protein ExbB